LTRILDVHTNGTNWSLANYSKCPISGRYSQFCFYLADETIIETEYEGTAQAGDIKSLEALPLSDLHALAVGLQARMLAQENKIVILKQENSQLWQEIHRVSSNRLSTLIRCLQSPS
jgi:hypothetical protein